MTDHGMTQADQTLNQKIRQDLMSDSNFRTSASNVHFNTNNGKVVLQGTVATEKDKQEIESKVEKMTGVKDVDNQLQIAPASSSAAGGMGSSPSASR
jgi:osmotically-inducible protein OsmY